VKNNTLQRKRAASLAGFYRFHARRDDRIPAVLCDLIGTRRPVGISRGSHTRQAVPDSYSPVPITAAQGTRDADAGRDRGLSGPRFAANMVA
jgi:hypothetical protein